ncbi:uncharacterized protein RSE6_13579 [Rhynchosporium secalis]|uniref:Cytochrome P450 n=1 Tax=Rhynchosporium secalis TaxID=38038 RepID=A0A1E1MT76_RHYSE|nr:uncharacterized protein RSE6_13579 [Rhynchosporium secalis]
MDTSLLLLLTIASPFLLTWLFTTLSAHRALKLADRTPPGLKRPPTLPYLVPILGHAFEFMKDGHNFMSKTSQYIDRAIPVRIVLPIFSNYVVSGPENVLAYFRESRSLSTTSRSVIIMKNAFGCPAHLVHQFEPREIPLGSKPEDNMEHQILRALNTGLSGTHLEGLAARFQDSLGEKIEKAFSDGDFATKWKEFPDLSKFVESLVFEAAVQAMFGIHMLALNPTFTEDFLKFNSNIGTLFMGLPRFMNPSACKTREKMVENIKRWLDFTSENCPIESLEDIDWEPFYGSKFIRERQVLLTRRGIVDETARAAENFAFMWAYIASANTMPAATWCLIEALHDPSLKQRLQHILPAAIQSESTTLGKLPKFDILKLCEEPLFSSVYAETLRLRVAVIIVRQPSIDNFSFRGWHIKKDEVLSLSTRTEAMNEDVWNSSTHPLTEFYSDRFIVDTNDPDSGPFKGNKVKNKDRKPYFALDGSSNGAWIPYGGGNHLCPGRHFAKREIITTVALLLSAYDMELIDEEKGKPAVDMKCFGFGTMPPNRPVPFRIQRR